MLKSLLFIASIFASAITYGQITITDDGSGTGTATWTADNEYILDGLVFVNDGDVLTIEAGTVIKGAAGTQANASALIVARGAQIFAEGTEDDPIIMTFEGDPLDGSIPYTTKGQWGGLIILGDARLNSIPGESAIEGIPTTEDITTNPYTLSGLTAQNDYQVYLRADCSGDNSDTSDWIGPISFTTACPSFSLPFAEDFDNGGSTPNCWSQSGAENWLFNTSGPNHVGNGGTLSGSTGSGGYFAVVDASGSEASGI